MGKNELYVDALHVLGWPIIYIFCTILFTFTTLALETPTGAFETN